MRLILVACLVLIVSIVEGREVVRSNVKGVTTAASPCAYGAKYRCTKQKTKQVSASSSCGSKSRTASKVR